MQQVMYAILVDSARREQPFDVCALAQTRGIEGNVKRGATYFIPTATIV